MKLLPILALLLAGVALTGCTSAQAAPKPSSPQTAAQAHFDPAELAKSYHVAGGGKFVQGTRDLCNLGSADSILIEDQKSVTHFDGSKSVTSFSLAGGQISYSTSWPNDVVGTGITSGTGTYTVNADSSGKPVSITGHATVTWHDEATNKISKKQDDLTFTLTKITQPDYCQPAG